MKSLLILVQLMSIACIALGAAQIPLHRSSENAPPTAVRSYSQLSEQMKDYVYNEEPSRVRPHLVSFSEQPSAVKPFALKRPVGISLLPTSVYPHTTNEQLALHKVNKSAYLKLKNTESENDWQLLDPKIKPKGDLEN